MIQHLIDNKYNIPRFCYHGLLSIAGNCRVCVIDDKEVKTSVSCAMCYESYRMDLVNDGAVVGVYVLNAVSIRENIFEFLLLSHPLDCPICDRGGECELQDMTQSFGSDRGRYFETKRSVRDKSFSISVSTHMARCIVCGRCVRFLREILGFYGIGIVGRGEQCEVSSYLHSICSDNLLYMGNIIDLCPVCYFWDFRNNRVICIIGSGFLYLFGSFAILCSCLNFVVIMLNTHKYRIYVNFYLLRLYYTVPVTYYSRGLVDNVYECVLCACCTASCPSYWWNGGSYLGPAVLMQLYRWVVDSRDSVFLHRVSLLDMGYNISLCHGIGNCTIVCPKNLNPASKISDMKSVLGFNMHRISGVRFFSTRVDRAENYTRFTGFSGLSDEDPNYELLVHIEALMNRSPFCDIEADPLCDIPHIFIHGADGMGKSAFVNALGDVASVLYLKEAKDLRGYLNYKYQAVVLDDVADFRSIYKNFVELLNGSEIVKKRWVKVDQPVFICVSSKSMVRVLGHPQTVEERKCFEGGQTAGICLLCRAKLGNEWFGIKKRFEADAHYGAISNARGCVNWSNSARKQVCAFKNKCNFVRKIQKYMVEYKLNFPLHGNLGMRDTKNYKNVRNWCNVLNMQTESCSLEGVRRFRSYEEHKREEEKARNLLRRLEKLENPYFSSGCSTETLNKLWGIYGRDELGRVF